MTKKLALQYPPPTGEAGFVERLSRYLSVNFRRIEDFVDIFITPAVVPSRAVILWWGAEEDCPEGWVICNGDNDTPDFRDLVPVGAGGLYDWGDTGGSKDSIVVSHDHTQDPHDHDITDPGHRHSFEDDAGFRFLVTTPSGADAANDGAGGTQTPYSFGAMDIDLTGITIDNATATNQLEGSSGTDANLQPYLALHFIMKV